MPISLQSIIAIVGSLASIISVLLMRKQLSRLFGGLKKLFTIITAVPWSEAIEKMQEAMADSSTKNISILLHNPLDLERLRGPLRERLSNPSSPFQARLFIYVDATEMEDNPQRPVESIIETIHDLWNTNGIRAKYFTTHLGVDLCIIDERIAFVRLWEDGEDAGKVWAINHKTIVSIAKTLYNRFFIEARSIFIGGGNQEVEKIKNRFREALMRLVK